MLDTLFLERWNVMLELIRERRRASRCPVREKLGAIASFIVDSYQPRPRPDEGDHRRGHARGQLLRRHAHRHDPRGLRPDRRDRSPRRRPSGEFKAEIDARFAAMAFYGAIEQLLTGWIFDLLPAGRGGLRARQVARRGDGLRRPADGAGDGRRPLSVGCSRAAPHRLSATAAGNRLARAWRTTWSSG